MNPRPVPITAWVSLALLIAFLAIGLINPLTGSQADQDTDDPRGDNAAVVKYRGEYWLAWDTESGSRAYFSLDEVIGFVEGSTLTLILRGGRSVNTWIRPDEMSQLVKQVPELQRSVIAEVENE